MNRSASASTRPPVEIQLDSVTRRFGGFAAVDDVTLHLGGRGTTALIGPNGAGKTTLFNLITGELKPTSGTVTMNGDDVTGRRAHEMARLGIGRSFQDVRVFGDMSVRENLVVYAQARVTASMTRTFFTPITQLRAGRRAGAKADEVLEYLGIEQLARERADDLSFAQQKLVAIGRLLALGPTMIFLDEPASGLDRTGREALAATMRRLAEDYPVCFVEHNTELVRELADRVVFLNRGQVLADGTADEVFSDPRLAEVYLGIA